MFKKNSKPFDILLSTEATHVHAHDDDLSHIKTPNGNEHYGMKGIMDAAQQVAPVYQECDEIVQMRAQQEKSNLTDMSRRGLLFAAAGVGGMLAMTSNTRYAYAAPGAANDGNIVIAIFLRGGADGLGIVAPCTGNDHELYQKMRPNLMMNANTMLKLPGDKFGIHPAMPNMQKMAINNQMSVIHATGHVNKSRSHFDKQRFMETGAMNASMSSGWLGRYMMTTGNDATFRAFTMGNQTSMTLAMDGGSLTPTMSDLGSFTVEAGSQAAREKVVADLQSMYGIGGGLSLGAVESTIDAAMSASDLAKQENTVAYPNGNPLAKRLQGVAKVIKADAGLEVVCVDDDGWDMHVKMNDGSNLMAGQLHDKLKQVDGAIDAFWRDLGPELQKKVTIVTMSEFGRTGSTNGANGTDHGYGNLMFVVGDNVRGGVVGKWPGLSSSSLDEGDLNIVNDYRDALAQVFMKKMGVKAGSTQMKQIFPDYTPKDFSLYNS